MNSLVSLIRDKQFARYLSAAILTAVGSGMYFVGISWYLYNKSGSSMTIGLVLIVSTLPGLILSPWIGGLVDRYNVRDICVASDIVRAAVLLLIGTAMYLDALSTELILIGTFFLSLCDNFFQPAVGALIRNIVQRDRLLEANASSNMCMQVGLLFGASLGGLLVASLGSLSVVAVNSLTFLISGLLTISIFRAAGGHPEQTARNQVAGSQNSDGFIRPFIIVVREITRSRLLMSLLFQQVMVYLTLYTCNTLLPAFVKGELGAGPQGFGVIDSAWGLGALCGGAALTSVRKRIRADWFGLVALAVLATALTIFLTAEEVFQAASGYFVLGCCAVIIKVNSDTGIVASVHPSIFGRVKSAFTMFIAYAGLALYGAVGYWGDRISTRWIYASIAIAITLSVIVGVFFKKTPRTDPIVT